jgi:hypothetical protein
MLRGRRADAAPRRPALVAEDAGILKDRYGA